MDHRGHLRLSLILRYRMTLFRLLEILKNNPGGPPGFCCVVQTGWRRTSAQLFQMTTTLFEGGCDALLDDETLSAVVTTFELSFSCDVSDSNDAATLLVVVTATHFTSSNTAFCRPSCRHVKALRTSTCVLCVCWSFTSDKMCCGPTYDGGRIPF